MSLIEENKDYVLCKTEYCCRTIFESGTKAATTAAMLDYLIESKKYKQAIRYIDTLGIDEEDSDKLKTCVKSYKRSC